jgi:hypothetical protein
MDIKLKQTRVLISKILSFLNIISLYIEALVPSFHKPLKTSSIKFFGLLSESGGGFPFHCYHDEGHDIQPRIVTVLVSPLPARDKACVNRFKMKIFSRKVMLTVFCDLKGILLMAFQPE